MREGAGYRREAVNDAGLADGADCYVCNRQLRTIRARGKRDPAGFRSSSPSVRVSHARVSHWSSDIDAKCPWGHFVVPVCGERPLGFIPTERQSVQGCFFIHASSWAISLVWSFTILRAIAFSSGDLP